MPQVYQPANPDQNLLANGGRPDQTGINQGAPSMGYQPPANNNNNSGYNGPLAPPSNPRLELPYANPTLEATTGVTSSTQGSPSANGGATSYPSGSVAPDHTNNNNASSGGNGSGEGGTPSGGGGYGGGGASGGGGVPSTTEQQLAELNAIHGTQINGTDYLLNEYNNLPTYQENMENLINTTYSDLIDLNNARIDEQLKLTLADYANQLDQAKGQFAQIRAKLEQMKATEADNLALAAAMNGDRGGVGKAQYSQQMQQRDQALYEIDLQQVNLEQQIQQAIADAKATGNYTKLAQQIELATAQFERLAQLAADVENLKTSDATRLDQYYLQVQELQQNAVLDKINYGIKITAEDMALFGLSGAMAQAAADELNSAQGMERQMLAEQLKSMQKANAAASYGGYGGGYGGGGGGSDEGSSGGGFSLSSAQLSELQTKSQYGNLYIYKDGTSTGKRLTITFDENGNPVSANPPMQAGEYIQLSDGTKLYSNGSGLTTAAEYNQHVDNTNAAKDDWISQMSAWGITGSGTSDIYNKAQKRMQEILTTARVRGSREMEALGMPSSWLSQNAAMTYMTAEETAEYNALSNLLNSYGGW